MVRQAYGSHDWSSLSSSGLALTAPHRALDIFISHSQCPHTAPRFDVPAVFLGERWGGAVEVQGQKRRRWAPLHYWATDI